MNSLDPVQIGELVSSYRKSLLLEIRGSDQSILAGPSLARSKSGAHNCKSVSTRFLSLHSAGYSGVSPRKSEKSQRKQHYRAVCEPRVGTALAPHLAIGHKRIGLDRLSLRGLRQGERACRPSSSAAPARKAKSFRREPSSLSRSAHSLSTSPGLARRGFELLGKFLWQAVQGNSHHHTLKAFGEVVGPQTH